MAPPLFDEIQRPSVDAILQCVAAISNALREKNNYAIIGGAALIAMGYALRATEDVDILVRTGTTFSIKNLLATHPGFSLDTRTRHLFFTPDPPVGNIPIDVLTPALAFIPESEILQAVDTDNGIRIVRPATLLNYKISSAYTRSTTQKKATDWTDVEYLIRWHSENNITLEPGTVVNATAEAFKDCQDWTSNRITEAEWTAIGGTLMSTKPTQDSIPTKGQVEEVQTSKKN